MAGDLKLLTDPSELSSHQDRMELVEEVPEWGVSIRFMTPTLQRLLAFDAARRTLDPKDTKDQAEEVIRSIAACAVDADGEPMFTTDAHMDWLRGRDPTVLVRLNNVCTRVCGASKEGTEASVGESEGTQGSVSGSD